MNLFESTENPERWTLDLQTSESPISGLNLPLYNVEFPRRNDHSDPSYLWVSIELCSELRWLTTMFIGILKGMCRLEGLGGLSDWYKGRSLVGSAQWVPIASTSSFFRVESWFAFNQYDHQVSADFHAPWSWYP